MTDDFCCSEAAVERNEKLFRNAIGIFGEAAQCEVAIEEMAELTKAIVKYRRAVRMTDEKCISTAVDNIIEEMADVHIMLMQLHFIFGHDEDFNSLVKRKLDRLEKMTKKADKDGIIGI